MTIDRRGLDPFDIAAVRSAYEEHQAVAEHETIQRDDDVHSDDYWRTEHDVDVLVEKLGLDYGDDMGELEQLWQGREQGITP